MLSFKAIRRIVIAVLGFSVVLIGIVMIVLPGPAVVVIPAGLAILGTEFVWARQLLKKVKQTMQDGANRVTGRADRKEEDANHESEERKAKSEGRGASSE